MRGLPKFFNTKQDLLNCLADENLKEAAKLKLKQMLENRFNWFDVELLGDKTGINDENHRVIDGMQQELREDKTTSLFRLGFTVEEAEEIIND